MVASGYSQWWSLVIKLPFELRCSTIGRASNMDSPKSTSHHFSNSRSCQHHRNEKKIRVTTTLPKDLWHATIALSPPGTPYHHRSPRCCMASPTAVARPQGEQLKVCGWVIKAVNHGITKWIWLLITKFNGMIKFGYYWIWLQIMVLLNWVLNNGNNLLIFGLLLNLFGYY